ncbi:hypothetical protein BKA82DRAFT_2362438 [Pisolithus tinctorius]|nr:hypothetical protein BKA82DRAFT_2807536 [Pisolithus tinctorius]KAI6144533.1 hypothetical protein BKA82DRAFT_2362438 [Pisolithus tinctorius]
MKASISLPTETKMKLYHRQGAPFRGYEPIIDSNVNLPNRGDLNESFVTGWEKLVPEENVDDTPVVAIRWPSGPAGFREACLDDYHAASGVAKDLYLPFALALDVPEAYFDDKAPLFPHVHS